jgi:hypothetical protein
MKGYLHNPRHQYGLLDDKASACQSQQEERTCRLEMFPDSIDCISFFIEFMDIHLLK